MNRITKTIKEPQNQIKFSSMKSILHYSKKVIKDKMIICFLLGEGKIF